MDACSKYPLFFFADNRIGVDGVKAVAAMLASNESLDEHRLSSETLLFFFSFFFQTIFSLAANPMGDGGAIALADALAHNNALAEINLNSQRGLFVFFDNFSLFFLKKSNFAGCKIGGSGGEALCQAFKINRSTTKIDLAGTCVVVRPKEESAV